MVRGVTFNIVILLVFVLLGATPLLAILQFEFSFGPLAFNNGRIESEIVNGIVTLSGLVFGFQYATLKLPKKGITKYMLLTSVVIEVFLLFNVGFWYVSDSLEFGYLTKHTLMVSFGSLGLNLSLAAFLMLLQFLGDKLETT